MSRDITTNPSVLDRMRSGKGQVFFLLSLLLFLAVIWLVFRDIHAEQFLQGLLSINRTLLFLYISAFLVSWVVRALRYQKVFHLITATKPSLYRMLLVTAIRNASVDLLPARLGELVYVAFVKRLGFDLHQGLFSMVTLIILDIAVLGLIVPLCFLIGAGLDQNLQLIVMFGAVAGALLLCALLQLPVVLRWLSLQLQRTAIGGGSFGLLLGKLSAESQLLRGGMISLICYTLLLRILKYSSLFCLLIGVWQGMGLALDKLHVGLTLVAFLAAEMSASLPISGFLGFGAYELTWGGIFSAAHPGIESSKVLAGIFALHLVTQVVAYSLCALAILLFLLEDRRSYDMIGASESSLKQ